MKQTSLIINLTCAVFSWLRFKRLNCGRSISYRVFVLMFFLQMKSLNTLIKSGLDKMLAPANISDMDLPRTSGHALSHFCIFSLTLFKLSNSLGAVYLPSVSALPFITTHQMCVHMQRAGLLEPGQSRVPAASQQKQLCQTQLAASEGETPLSTVVLPTILIMPPPLPQPPHQSTQQQR